MKNLIINTIPASLSPLSFLLKVSLTGLPRLSPRATLVGRKHSSMMCTLRRSTLLEGRKQRLGILFN